MKPVISELARALDKACRIFVDLFLFSFFFLFYFLFSSSLSPPPPPQERSRKWRKHRDVRRELSKAFRKLSSPWIVTHEMRLGRSSANYSQHLAIWVRDQLRFNSRGYFRVPFQVKWFELGSISFFVIDCLFSIINDYNFLLLLFFNFIYIDYLFYYIL